MINYVFISLLYFQNNVTQKYETAVSVTIKMENEMHDHILK